MGLKVQILVLLTVFCLISVSRANWYGKRGDKLDQSLYQLLQGGMPGMIDRHTDAQMTIAAIDKLIQDYRLRQAVDSKAAERK